VTGTGEKQGRKHERPGRRGWSVKSVVAVAGAVVGAATAIATLITTTTSAAHGVAGTTNPPTCVVVRVEQP
jgi:hypothetical protein